MAIDLIRRGKQVILAGRTESTLAATAKEIGATAHYVLDTGDIPSINPFISKITSEHPDLDCVINNAGIQVPLQLFGPDYDFNLDKADQEININIRGPLHLCVGLIQKHFVNLPSAVIMNVSSGLGFVPFMVINPVYNGTKAWLHFFTTTIRTQIEHAGKNIKVIEIVPPAVETDLHRDRVNPDDNKKSSGAKTSLSIEEYMADVSKGWEADQDTIAPGMSQTSVDAWENAFGKRYKEMTASGCLFCFWLTLADDLAEK